MYKIQMMGNGAKLFLNQMAETKETKRTKRMVSKTFLTCLHTRFGFNIQLISNMSYNDPQKSHACMKLYLLFNIFQHFFWLRMFLCSSPFYRKSIQHARVRVPSNVFQPRTQITSISVYTNAWTITVDFKWHVKH